MSRRRGSGWGLISETLFCLSDLLCFFEVLEAHICLAFVVCFAVLSFYVFLGSVQFDGMIPFHNVLSLNIPYTARLSIESADADGIDQS